ncbi:MAG: LysE family translocator [Chloroflexota bacterium]
MPALSTIALFVLAAFVLLITPGPSVLYIVARSINQGRQAGFVSALGIATATLCHIAAATLGLSAILMSSALAFSIVKYIGAAYLVYLGMRTLLSREESQQASDPAPRKLPRIYYQGFLVNLLNPKTALFFFAFLPQFIDPTKGAVAGQTLFLGFIFVAMGICSDSTYALLAGTFGSWLKGNLRFLRAQKYFAGSVYIVLGVTTALAGSSKGK